jgi:hypothetical protein
MTKEIIAENFIEKKERINKIVGFYAHDYRDMKISQGDLEDILNSFVESLQCQHECTSNCRREGCKCACGEYHF